MKKSLLDQITQGDLDASFLKVYDAKKTDEKKERAIFVAKEFKDTFKEDAEYLFSAPGRTEIGGNHTDHQKGCVIAASINLDALAAVRINNLGMIRIQSQGYPMVNVDFDNLSPKLEEFGSTTGLVRGVLSAFKQRGCELSDIGFDAYVVSDVLSGSGLSSSAAFEILVGTIINKLFWNDKCTAIELAQMGQYAENIYFGKPCGLMDQTACSVGGVVSIDFGGDEPVVKSVPLDFADMGHALCIVDSGVDHADLTDEYSHITREMAAVANYFDAQVLSSIDKQAFYDKLPELRAKLPGRALLRAIHYFTDTELAVKEAQALKNKEYDTFLKYIAQSGTSSIQCLQNVVPTGETACQGLLLAITLCQLLLDGEGAVRVHGGGFAGTVQAFVPMDKVENFRSKYEAVFGENTCHVLSIRPVGGICFN